MSNLSVDGWNDPTLGIDSVNMVKGQKDQYVWSAGERIIEIKQYFSLYDLMLLSEGA